VNTILRPAGIVAIATLTLFTLSSAVSAESPSFESQLIFPARPDHNHAASIVECPNGDLLASWYRGHGERDADDVAVYGARLRKGEGRWSEAFLMADTPGFPDCNTAMFVDAGGRLWLFWPTIIANTWESCITNYRVSKNFTADGAPTWDWQGVILLKPQDFERSVLEALEARLKSTTQPALNDAAATARVERYRKLASNKLLSRLGWQPRCKPTVLPSGRILLPLYSDTYSAGLMAISDDGGKSWYASKPLVGFGSIQPTVLRRNDGTLVAYMRENGPIHRIRISESNDDGITWGPVGATDLANPGSGIDAVRLDDGRWVLVYNDTTRGRSSLAVSISDDEGRTWKYTRHLEKHDTGSYHYPAVIQSKDRQIHILYSHYTSEGQSIKHAVFNATWILQGDSK